MDFHRPLCLFFVLFLSLLLSSSEARKFDVGGTGSAGWTPNPSENYNQWSGRNRFNVNDTIVFKYKKGSDSVLEVKKEDYDKCNKTNPIKKFEEGETEFKLDRPGPFYFISGKDKNCENGQKLIVLVITPRKQTPPSVPTPTSPPKSSPTPSPPSGSPPAMPPTSVSPSPASSPVPAGGPPASSPTPTATSPSPSPVSTPPAGGPPMISPAPTATSPSPSPMSTPPAGGPPTPSPMSTPPASGPPTTSPSPGATPPPGSTPTGGPPAPGTAAPQGSSGSSVSPPSFLVYSVTVVVGAAFLRY